MQKRSGLPKRRMDMGKCDVIKAFFLNFRRIEPRIMERIDEYDRYFELATRITPSYAGMPSGGGDAGSKVENGAIMMKSVLDDLDKEITELRAYRRLVRRVIDMTGDPRYMDVLTLRYLNGYGWERICEAMKYERTQVWRIHGYALVAADHAMQKIIGEDEGVRAVYEKIRSEVLQKEKDGMECNMDS